MPHTLEEFAAACQGFLSADPGRGGREKVRNMLQHLLVDEDFLAKHLGPDNKTPKQVIYEDRKLGFQILAHVNEDACESPPHDHGTTWAIYGQARGVTEMREYRVIRPGSETQPKEVEVEKTYQMTPGVAVIYDEYKVHSPKRYGPTKLIRITGWDVDKLKRSRIALAPEAVPAE